MYVCMYVCMYYMCISSVPLLSHVSRFQAQLHLGILYQDHYHLKAEALHHLSVAVAHPSTFSAALIARIARLQEQPVSPHHHV
jgi:hypothetical protein